MEKLWNSFRKEYVHMENSCPHSNAGTIRAKDKHPIGVNAVLVHEYWSLD